MKYAILTQPCNALSCKIHINIYIYIYSLFLLILINFSYCFSIQRLHIEVFQVLVPNYLIILLRVSISNISKVYNEYLFLIYLLFGYSFVYFFVFLHERCLRSIFLLKLKDKEVKYTI